jgi:hypothetical protein
VDAEEIPMAGVDPRMLTAWKLITDVLLEAPVDGIHLMQLADQHLRTSRDLINQLQASHGDWLSPAIRGLVDTAISAIEDAMLYGNWPSSSDRPN